MAPAAPASGVMQPRAMQQRYVTLDGMRGIAAMAVALFHFNISQAPHGYVAVDFFFVLSGFVLCRTYQPRLREGLGVGQFLTHRLVRLYPLFLTGIVVTGIAAATDGFEGATPRIFAISTALNAFMIPSPLTVTLFPFNVPAWSLFFELVANLAMILLLFRLPAVLLAGVSVVCAVLLVHPVVANGSANLGAVWKQWDIALMRTAFSFCAGMVIARLPQPGRRSEGGGGLLCLIAICLCLLARPSGPVGPIYDLVFAFVLSPVLVWAGTRVEPPASIARGARFLGDVSYGLYAIHWSLMGVFRHFKDDLGYNAVLVAIAYLATGITLAWIASRWIDRPLREKLGRLFRSRSTREPEPVSDRPS